MYKHTLLYPPFKHLLRRLDRTRKIDRKDPFSIFRRNTHKIPTDDIQFCYSNNQTIERKAAFAGVVAIATPPQCETSYSLEV